jgi:hypothetical protein
LFIVAGKRKRTPILGTVSDDDALRAADASGEKVAVIAASEASILFSSTSVEWNRTFTFNIPEGSILYLTL